MSDPSRVLRPYRRWPLFIIPAVVVAAAFAWSGFWYYASATVSGQFDGWRAREAQSGRAFDCGKVTYGGFPFRFEARCDNASVGLTAQSPGQLSGTAHLASILAVTQIYDPQLMISEFTAPMTIADSGQQPSLEANWTLGQASVFGLPVSPQRGALVLDNPTVDQLEGSVRTPLLRAKHVEVHGRIAGGSVTDHPIIDVAIQLDQASAEGLHPLAAAPFDLAAQARMRGLKDFSPKAWPARFREIQAAGGRIDITQSRVQQGDMVAVASGSLGLSPNGHLDGELQIVIAGIEKIIPALGIDKMLADGAPQASLDKVAPGLKTKDVNNAMGALDRLIPGLGGAVRKQAPAIAAASIAMLGQKTTLEGRSAQAFPLRFVDGVMYLGSIRVAQTPAVF